MCAPWCSSLVYSFVTVVQHSCGLQVQTLSWLKHRWSVRLIQLRRALSTHVTTVFLILRVYAIFSLSRCVMAIIIPFGLSALGSEIVSEVFYFILNIREKPWNMFSGRFQHTNVVWTPCLVLSICNYAFMSSFRSLLKFEQQCVPSNLALCFPWLSVANIYAHALSLVFETLAAALVIYQLKFIFGPETHLSTFYTFMISDSK